jgi:ornithine cyclodeaminase/alanine dehydrogenase-like protein (mu-crystallin family)
VNGETIILSDLDVAALLPHAEVIGMVDTVFQEWGRGNVVMPPKVNLDMSRSGHDSWSNAMPAYLVSGSWGQAEHRGELKLQVEAGRLDESSIAAELGSVAAGKTPGRSGPQERIMAVLVGLGAHDVYVAGQVYQRAIAAGCGQRVRLRHE